MNIAFEYNPKVVFITPVIAFGAVMCDHCDCAEIHGYVLTVGWLIFSVHIQFPKKTA